MSRTYNEPGVVASDVGTQFRTDHFAKRALIEARKEQYFMPLSGTVNMPKNMGKKIKKYHYIPLLDDENLNDQGLDAAGAVILITGFDVQAPRLSNLPRIVEADEASFALAHLDGDIIWIVNSGQWLILTGDTAIGYDSSTTGGADGTELSDNAVKAYLDADSTGVVATVTNEVIVLAGGDAPRMQFTTEAAADLAVAVCGGSVKTQNSGNLYGSSKDIGLIPGKLPALSENGGRVNRVGFKRKDLEGTIEKFGFFDEYTKESLDFDTDAELKMHINREMVNGAVEMTEDALQIDLLNSAGVVRFAGNAVSNVTLDKTDVVDYSDLLKLSIDLDNNRTPKQTQVIVGTRLIDTKTISGGRVLYCGSELQPTLEAMTDLHSERAFVPVRQYAAGSTIMNGEIGAIGHWRIIIVPEMLKWTGAGANAEADATNYETANAYDVFPMLAIGSGSFTTIGFQTDGKTVKFKIKHSEPESPESYAIDPYGETGFMSIKWYYGFLLERSERIGLIKTTATL